MTIVESDRPARTLEDRLGRTTTITTSPPAPEPSRPARPARPAPSTAAVWLLAALSAGAGVIHLVMVPSHAGEWAPEGVAFAVTGWAQIGVALLLVLRPSRVWAWAGIAVSGAALAAWAVSRAWGLPVGPEAGVPHPIALVDLTCVALEAMFVVVALAVLARPALGRRLGSAGAVAFSVLPIAAIVAASVAVASPSALTHGHDEAAGAAGASGASGASGHAHDMAGMSPDQMAAHEAHQRAELAFLFPDGDDRGWSDLQNGDQHGTHAPDVPIASLDPATRAEYERQMALTVEVAKRYPTVAAAEAAGYVRVGPFSPGLGAHYTGGVPDFDGVMTDAEILRPTGIVFAGTSPDSAAVGFMYASTATPEALDHAGFAGPNDHWHTHSGVCLKPGVGGMDALGSDGSISAADCTAQGGTFMADIRVSLLHVWTVPAYTSPIGVFSHLNPAVTCPDGGYRTCRPL